MAIEKAGAHSARAAENLDPETDQGQPQQILAQVNQGHPDRPIAPATVAENKVTVEHVSQDDAQGIGNRVTPAVGQQLKEDKVGDVSDERC